MKYPPIYYFLFVFSFAYSQLLDDYDGVSGLTYSIEGTWVISNGIYECQTNGLSSPEHSFASYDLANSQENWSLDKSNENEWIGWMDLNRSIVSGWGGSNYSCGMIIAANSSDFNESTTSGYAIGFKNDTSDDLVLFRFSEGIMSGTTSLPGSSTEIVNSGYSYLDSDNGINFYVKQNTNGTWTIKYKAGSQFSVADAVNHNNYSDGSVTSISPDETYTGITYKYAGWVYAHSSSSSEKAYFDNFGIGSVDQSLPVELSSFSAECEDHNIILTWVTESEIENIGFILERRTYLNNLNDNWVEIANYQTNKELRGQGSVTHRTEYTFIDRTIEYGKFYDYRIADVSYNGVKYFHSIEVLGMEIHKDPEKLILYDNYPNPFNSSTHINYYIPDQRFISLTIYDVNGNHIIELINSIQDPGIKTITWNGRNKYGCKVSSGVYLYKISSNKVIIDIKKMIILN